ncbi:TolC family protein [Clostridium ganghwense]|uniref:TolC family protein n=1 Tax=Clostridium ganghwense TaxID=312089 RepID=A0ABT4CT17_9CLOT|nr:TolC family protein [Clostridium ganghwense]MCY6371336.1 TolC family protein [Clostridium ganghwense]
MQQKLRHGLLLRYRSSKKKKYKRALGSLLFILMVLNITFAYADVEEDKDNLLILTKEKAISTAIQNSNDLKRIDLDYNKLQRDFNNAKEKSDEAQETLDALERYKYLYEKEQDAKQSPLQEQYNQKKEELKIEEDKLTEMEQAEKPDLEQIANQQQIITNLEKEIEELKSEINKLSLSPSEQEEMDKYRKTFVNYGEVPPTFSDEEEFKLFIRDRDLKWYEVQGKIEKQNINVEKAKKSIELKVGQIWNQIVQIYYSIKIKKDLYELQSKEFVQIEMKFKNGQTSKLDKDIAENELKKLELQIDNLIKDKENSEMMLKKEIGISIDKEIKLDFQENKIKEVSEYSVYLQNALKNRGEIKIAEIDLDIKERELGIADDYLDEDNMEFKEINEQLYEKQIFLQDAKKQVEKNVKELYMNVCEKKSEFDLKVKSLEKKKSDLKAADNRYQHGTISLDKLWKDEVAKTQAEIEYKAAKINYIEAMCNLEMACEIGY